MKNFFVISALMSFGLFVGCSEAETSKGSNNQKESIGNTANNQKTPEAADDNLPVYKVATLRSYPPFATTDKYGISTGLDIDLMKAIARKEGFKPQFITHEWKKWETDLTQDRVDIWIAGITVKEKRKKVALYSDPYMTYKTAIMTRDDKESSGITESTLENYNLGAESDTTSLVIAKKLNPNPEQVKNFTSNSIAFEALQRKEINAIIGNNVVLANIANSFPEYKIKLQDLSDSVTPAKELGILVKKDRVELAAKINSGLKAVKADGEFNEIKKKWLGDYSK